MKLALIRKTRETSSTNFYFKSCFFLQKWTENDLEIGHFEKMTLFKEENERYYKAHFFTCCKQANNFPKVKTSLNIHFYYIQARPCHNFDWYY